MGMSAQDKMLNVASRLGLTTLKDMQGTTRMVYDSNTTAALTHTFFKGAAQRAFPLTNVGANGNQFQVNEALLVEKIGFFIPTAADGIAYGGLAGNAVKFDLVIGNKTVLKDVSCEFGGEQAFYNDGNVASSVIDLEGVGILIPPQVEYYVVAKSFDGIGTRTGTSIRLGCYLFGTGALLNFNTTI
jgi:hypothetical protein